MAGGKENGNLHISGNSGPFHYHVGMHQIAEVEVYLAGFCFKV